MAACGLRGQHMQSGLTYSTLFLFQKRYIIKYRMMSEPNEDTPGVVEENAWAKKVV